MRISLLRSPVLGLLTAWVVTAAGAGVAAAEGDAQPGPSLPERTQAVVQRLTAPQGTSVNGGIVAGAGALAPHCETPGSDLVRSATIAGNIMCIISRRPDQAGGDAGGAGAPPVQPTVGQALEAILNGPR